MRIQLSHQKRFAIILVIVLLWLTFAMEVIPSYVATTASKGASILAAVFAGAICLFDLFLMAYEAVDYWIDEDGISLYGFFGHIKLKTFPGTVFPSSELCPSRAGGASAMWSK